ALKVIRKEKLSSDEAVKRFYQEVQAAARLQHPHIAIAYDAGPVGGTHFLSMEFIDGTDLAQLVKQHGPLPVARACDYVRRAADGLMHLYALVCSLYFLLVGRAPFHAESLTQLLLKHQMESAKPLTRLRNDVPAELEEVVDRLLAKKPEDRFQTAAELAQAL